MHVMCLEDTYQVAVPYRGAGTLSNLITQIQKGTPVNFVDPRLTDTHFPQFGETDSVAHLRLVSFNHWWGGKEDVVGRLAQASYVPINAAELFALRVQHPRVRFSRVVALCQPWRDERGYQRVPCLGSGSGDGLRVRDFNSGWAPFWKFAVKKAESE